MRSADLKHAIRILKPTEGATDIYGRRSVTWSTFAEVYAKVSDVSGREFYEAAAYQYEKTVSFSVRALAVTTDMRVEFRDDIYEIKQINHLGYKGDFITMRCLKTEAEAYGVS